MLPILRALLALQLRQDFFDILKLQALTDKNRITSFHDCHVLTTQSCDQAASPVEIAAPSILNDDLTCADVSFSIGDSRLIKGFP